MSETNAKRTTRQARRSVALGPDAACSRCGYADPSALVKRRGKLLCYECAQGRDGKATTEAHHLHGRENDPTTVGVPGNTHRALSDAQLDWPQEARHNPERDPLRWLASLLYSLRDYLAYLARHSERIARWLLRLAQALQERFGAQWWVTLGLEAL